MIKCQNCEKEIPEHRKYCSLKCRNVYVNKYLRDYSKNAKGLEKKTISVCLQCQVSFKHIGKRKFCSQSCSATYNNLKQPRILSEEAKISKSKKASINAKNLWNNPEYASKQFRREIFSSKGERTIKEYLKNTLPQYEWKSGGLLKLNDTTRLSRDCWSDVLKVCIEYDGDWHFIDIKGQLEKKQLKDKLLEEWCLKNSYKIIRIDERYKLNLKELETLIFNQSQVIKLGSRYDIN